MGEESYMIIFIPIKKNSQRVPNKNFRLFRGVPLYKHVLKKFSNHSVFVDTDSDEIINQCKIDPELAHVHAFAREYRLLGDKTSVCDLVSNFIANFKISKPIAQLHVTSPFIDPDVVEDAYSMLGIHDSVVSCSKIQSRLWRKEKYGYCPVNHNPLKLEQTQDLPDIFEENSCFYIFDPSVVVKTGNRIGKTPFFYPIEYPQSLDIDTEKDWQRAIGESFES